MIRVTGISFFPLHDFDLLIRWGIEMLVDLARNFFLAYHTNQTFCFLAVLEENQCRYRANAVTMYDGCAIIDIQFDESRTLCVLLGDRCNCWRQRLARPAPCSPEIN